MGRGWLLRPERQRGQAMVLIALMIGALCAMLGLAIDSGRAFVDRREIQNSADAAAVAGAVTYIRQGSFANAELAMVDTYAKNRSLTYSASPCTPSGWPSPGSGASTPVIHCTFTNDSSQSLDLTVTDFAPPSSFEEFTATGNHSLLTAIIQAVGGGNTLSVAATGCAATWDSSTCAAVPPVVLAESSLCGSGGDALTLTGANGSTPAVVGNVGSYGDTHVTAGSTPNIAGDTTYYCGSSPSVNSLCYPTGGSLSGCTYPTTTLHTGKPPTYGFTPASGSGTVSSSSGLGVNVDGGVFDSTTVGRQGFGTSGTWYFGSSVGPYSNPCYFLSGGVYKFSAVNVASQSGVVSNELRPPDEPVPTSDKHTTVATKQLWNMNGAKCAGSFTLAAATDTTGFALPIGAYAIRLTSVRYDSYGAKSYERESSPSTCKSLSISSPLQGLTVNVSNVPGAQDYNVYVSSTVLSLAANDHDPEAGKCDGYFYQLATIPVQNYVNETNADTSQCPSSVTNAHCTLGASAQTDLNLCALDRVETFLGVLGSVPVGCTTLLNSVPDIQPQPAFSCSASAYIQVPPPKGTLRNPPVSHACGWPGPFVSCTGGLGAGTGQYCLNELLSPADSNLPDQDEAVNYETADWGLCYDSSTQKQTLCSNQYGGYNPSGLVTPGAVQFQTDTGCFSFAGGGYPFLFSGYQYAWGLLMHSGTTSGCADSLSPAYGGEFVGHYYGPQVSATVAGTTTDIPVYGPQAPTLYGCFIANQPTVDGTNGLAVYFVTPTPNIAISGYGIPTASGC